MKNDDLLEVFETNYRFYFVVVFGIVKNIDDAEDVLHNAFLKAYRADKSKLKNGEMKKWFTTVCKNTALTYIGKQKNDANRELQYVQENSRDDTDEDDALLKIIVEQQLKCIPTELLPYFREYIFEGVPIKVICKKYGVSRDKMRYWKKQLEKKLCFLYK